MSFQLCCHRTYCTINRDLFTVPPDANLLCAICHGVFENPVSLSCGHVYCLTCADHSLANDELCPACRKGHNSGDGCVPAIVVSGLIGNLQVKCLNNNTIDDHEDASNEPPHQRRRTGSNGEGVLPQTMMKVVLRRSVLGREDSRNGQATARETVHFKWCTVTSQVVISAALGMR
jgi:hypothetical protein